MAKIRSARQPVKGNPFTLLAQAYQERQIDECLDLLINIFVYLRRKMPPRSLRKQWKKTLSLPDYLMDFPVKLTGKIWKGVYHIRLAACGNTGEYECYLDYSNMANAVSIDGKKSLIAKRGLQLIGMR